MHEVKDLRNLNLHLEIEVGKSPPVTHSNFKIEDLQCYYDSLQKRINTYKQEDNNPKLATQIKPKKTSSSRNLES